MADVRKRFSGAQYQKIRDEKREKEEEVLKKIPKLDTFFKKRPREGKHYQISSGIYSKSKILIFITIFDHTSHKYST